MVCLESDYERSYSKLPETGPNSKMTKSLVVEVVRVTTELPWRLDTSSQLHINTHRILL